MARKITKRQQQIYDYILAYQLEKGYPPSVREMAAAVGLSSPSTVHAHLNALEDHGLLKRDKTKPRAIELFNADGTSALKTAEVVEHVDRGSVSLPLVGRVAAGMPILAEQNVEDTFTVPTEIATDSSSFVLEVHGDSMINAGIYNGDYIIVGPMATDARATVSNKALSLGLGCEDYEEPEEPQAPAVDLTEVLAALGRIENAQTEQGKQMAALLDNRVVTRVLNAWPSTEVTAQEIDLEPLGSTTDTTCQYSYTVTAAPEGEDAQEFTGQIGLELVDGVWTVTALS